MEGTRTMRNEDRFLVRFISDKKGEGKGTCVVV